MALNIEGIVIKNSTVKVLKYETQIMLTVPDLSYYTMVSHKPITPISIRVALLGLIESYDFPRTIKAIQINMDRCI